jgi:hypothetical protein
MKNVYGAISSCAINKSLTVFIVNWLSHRKRLYNWAASHAVYFGITLSDAWFSTLSTFIYFKSPTLPWPSDWPLKPGQRSADPSLGQMSHLLPLPRLGSQKCPSNSTRPMWLQHNLEERLRAPASPHQGAGAWRHCPIPIKSCWSLPSPPSASPPARLPLVSPRCNVLPCTAFSFHPPNRLLFNF